MAIKRNIAPFYSDNTFGDVFVWEELSTSMFDLPLHSNNLQTLESSRSSSLKFNSEDIHYVDFVTNMSLLPLFIQRGQQSGMWYQPPINHRELDIQHLNKMPDNSDTTLLQSCNESASEFSFDNCAHISFMPYMLAPNDADYNNKLSENPNLGIHGFSIAHVPVDNKHVSRYMCIKNYHAIPVTTNCLNRLFEVFGCKRENTEDPVTLNDYGVIFTHLSQFSLRDDAAIDKFCGSLCFEKFEWKEGVTVVEKRQQLVRIIQDLIPFRLAVFDGQHRICAVSTVLEDYATHRRVPLGLHPRNIQFKNTAIAVYSVNARIVDVSGDIIQVGEKCQKIGYRDNKRNCVRNSFTVEGLLDDAV